MSSDGHHIPKCRSCGDEAYIETFDIQYGARWDEDVFGYVKTEYDIDLNRDRVVFHLEYAGYFTGYYWDTDILKPENQAMYSMVLNQMVKDLEEVPPLPAFSVEVLEVKDEPL